MSLTQENATDLHSLDSPLTLAMKVGGKRIDPVINVSLYYCMT
jgi:hypothetical protein